MKRRRKGWAAVTLTGVGMMVLGFTAPTSQATEVDVPEEVTTAPPTSTPTTEDEIKVFVCKYVGTPGVDERLQTGENPINVSISSIPVQPVVIGAFFADAQGRSVVIAFAEPGQHPEPNVNDCPPPDTGTTTTTSTTAPPTTSSTSTSSTTTSTTSTSTTSTTAPSTTTTALVDTFGFTAVVPVCIADAPFIEITFGDNPEFNGLIGTLSFFTIEDEFIESIALEYQANTTVQVVFPGAEVDPVTGEALDWPGWVQNEDGLWVEDPTDAIFREGVLVVYEVNPTAEAFAEYPPATAACASPENPPGTTVPGQTATTAPRAGSPTLPRTGGEPMALVLSGALLTGLGAASLMKSRRVAS